MNPAQEVLGRLLNTANIKAQGAYLRWRNGFADACWAMLLVYALIGGVNALLCVRAIAWGWLR